MISIKKNRNAFGLVEVLISVSVIAVIIAALVGIARMVLMNTIRAQERAQAVRLAQEGIEMVRQIRDTGWIDRDNTTEWDTLAINPATNDWVVPDSNSEYEIAFDSSNLRYFLRSTSGDGVEIGLDGGKFYRKIRVEDVTNLVPDSGSVEIRGYAKKVTVTVLAPGDKRLAVSEVITNWRPNY